MRRLWLVPVVVVVFVLAGVGYWAFGTSLKIDRSVMSRLAVPSTGIPSFKAKPYVHGVQQFASVPSRIVSQEAARDPANTGIYAIGWKNASDTNDADLLIEFLPTDATAETARKSFETQYANKKDYGAAGLTRLGDFAIPEIPGVFTSSFASETRGSPTSYVDVIVFRVGRVAVSTVVNAHKRAGLDGHASSFAVSEKNLLEREEPGFSMSSKVHRPITALWWGLGALVVCALVVGTAPLLRYRRARREHHVERLRHRQQQHITARGGKVLKRRPAPAWQAGRHRAGHRARR
jgi:hypothetical protein